MPVHVVSTQFETMNSCCKKEKSEVLQDKLHLSENTQIFWNEYFNSVQQKTFIEKGHQDPILVDNVLACAREHFEGLSNEMVDLIQNTTGVDLRIE